MTYEQYALTPYAIQMEAGVFTRLEALARVAVDMLISKLVPPWVDVSVCSEAITECTAIQIAYLFKNDPDQLATGREVKSESLDGYSRSYGDNANIAGAMVSHFAEQRLITALEKAGLMYRGLPV